jgi:acyl-CoA synthetase (AMP-forming)/AMP-acid ligase II
MPDMLGRARLTFGALDTLRRVGLLRPRVAVTATRAMRLWGPTVAAGYAASAQRVPERTAVVDDEGSLTFAEIEDLSDRVAIALAARGVGAHTPVGVLVRNSRWFVLTTVALNKLGASILYMNTGFAGPQLADVMRREGGTLLIHDDEFSGAVVEHAPGMPRIVADRADSWSEVEDLPRLASTTGTAGIAPPRDHGREVILTSGTTGLPKGAVRSLDGVNDLVASTALFQRVPFRVNDVHVVPAPMFHSLGAAALLMAGSLSQTLVVTRRFEPERIVALIAENRARGMTAVPVMLQRMLELPAEELSAHDTSSLEVVLCSGAALPGSLATRWMDAFGDNLYNLYGSTEVAVATVASPEQLRDAPGTAGTPLSGVDVRLYDEQDVEITEPHVDGRIFVGSALRFEGYTGGETKPSIEGLLSSGDVGYWDEQGRLFVEGRDDDMIVSGGENLYPREVEDLLADHEEIEEAAVIGVEDDEFGKRLVAFVVPVEGTTLDEAAVKAYVKANLANFKVPRSVTFIDELPRNATGKVLKRELHRYPTK